MLKGTFRLKDIIVTLEGYDIAGTFTFYLSCPLRGTVKKIDYGIILDDEQYIPQWDVMYIGIGSGNIKTDCNVLETEVDGKKVKIKNKLNEEFFITLGSILRGMKYSCYTSNRVDYLDKMMGVYSPSKITSYNIPNWGRVDLDMGGVVAMEAGDQDPEKCEFYLKLEEDGSYDLKVNGITKIQHKFKLDLEDFELDTMDSGWYDGSDDEIFSLSEIIEKNPDKSYLWLKDRKYHIVNDLNEMEKICKEIWNHDGIVSFDTETTGLNVTFKSRVGDGDRLVGMVFSIREGEAWYFPIAHKRIDNICTLSNERYIIDKYFKPILENKKILCHNGSFDWKVMHIYDIFLNLVHDSLILYKLTLWNDHRNLELALKRLAKVILDRDSFELSDFVSGKWGSNDIKFWDLPYESVKYYACPDTDSALGLLNYGLREGLLEKYGANKIYEVEVAFSIVIAYQEFYGHCADVERSNELAKQIDLDMDRLYKEMVEIVGHDFNPNSTKELPKVMFEELGYPSIFKTDTGNPSTGKKALKWLMGKTDENDKPLYPLAKLVKQYKDNRMLKSNFIDVMGKLATDDGFMFSNVNQFLETGRVSVNNPNYQSYNDTVKHYIIPREGYYMMDSDYSSVEYRILASMAGQENLIESFKDPDTDYHAYQASRMFGVPYELVTKQLRSQAKGVNFGLPYGMADPSLGEHIYGTRSAENTLKAKKLRKLYFEGQEKVEQFFLTARANGVKNSYSDTYFGRRRYFDRRKKDKGSIEREAGNNRIQGTAADIYKIAMVRLLTEVRKRGWLGKVLISAFVHDECVLEVHKSIDPAKMLKLLQECLMLKLDGWCPLYIGAGFGTNWYDAKKTEIPVQVQDIIVDNWGDSGIEWWDGNTGKLFDWEVGLINDYKRDRVINYLRNEDNYGKVLKPVENAFAHEVLDELNSGRHVDGVVDKDVKSMSDTVDNLEQFCKAFGVSDLFEKANIQRPNYDEVSKGNVDIDNVDTSPIDYEYNPFEEALSRVRNFGVGLDTQNRVAYFDYCEKDQVGLKLACDTMKKFPGQYKVVAVKEGELYSTEYTLSSKGYTLLLQLFMSRMNYRV